MKYLLTKTIRSMVLLAIWLVFGSLFYVIVPVPIQADMEELRERSSRDGDPHTLMFEALA